MTTKEEIKKWFLKGYKKGFTHLLVICDTFSNEDFPVYVPATTNIHITIDNYNQRMQRVMEVYSYALDLDTQLAEPHAYHLD